MTLLGLSMEYMRCSDDDDGGAGATTIASSFAVRSGSVEWVVAAFFLPRNKNRRAMAAFVSFEVPQLTLLLLQVHGLVSCCTTLLLLLRDVGCRCGCRCLVVVVDASDSTGAVAVALGSITAATAAAGIIISIE